MNKITKVFVFITVVMLLSGCNMPWSKNDKSEQSKANTQQQMPPIQVKVFVAKKEDIPITFSYPAKIVSKQSVDVVSKVSGTILEQYFKPGDSVKKGDKLFLIDPKKYKAAQEISNANLQMAKANFERTRLNYSRALKLKKTNSISKQEFDNSVSEYKSAQANIESAQATLKNANIDLNYTLVRAPFDGIIGDTYQDKGTFITLQNNKLVRLTNLNPIHAKFAIADVDMLNINQKKENKEWLQKDTNATLIINDKRYNGKLIFIDKVVNNQTGSIDAKAIFENSQQELLPGYFGTVKLSGFYQKGGFKIPQVAIKQNVQGSYVFLLKDGKVTTTPIEISYQTSEYAIISKGLSEGDKIIINNFMKIRPGAPAVEAKAE
ncbi:multidrug efflux system CmeABC, periplasmic fusion protein CmeA [Campylobacter blaseri]|uniref:Efflux transporter periplasmic adaptor subunit n=1 Tax=Campylobacter blaseri TaxID=2042961 RepID=A0A2P8R0W4_9BACT|nr:efflux RND transporter periplasmic adaptor subunit [Campylobacter blaseri]PSM52137.1 efflux transporter periplasmic adaptor subunit [Campylobacter blaseri]PSM53903.1 efflux transporter periplasmic adaptor subunit [Campylobacter blaseri]QKF85337.1 multidrug efflux system CmeABC, periplasmic fusion protein CmeA [Campylobacter blaseri]